MSEPLSDISAPERAAADPAREPAAPVRTVAGTTPIFNKLFKSIDDLLYSPIDAEFGRAQKDPEEWWTQNMPDYGIDTVQTVRETT